MYKIAVILFSLILMTTQVQADAHNYDSAKRYIETLFNQLILEVKQNKDRYDSNPDELNQLVAKLVLPSVDIVRFSRLVLGKYWKVANEMQREMFVEALKNSLMRSYSKSLILLSDINESEFLFQQHLQSKKAKSYHKISSRIKFKNGDTPMMITYVVHHLDGQWLIFDLVIDGLSIVRQLRSSYDREIIETSLDAVVKRLSAQNTSIN